MRKLLLILALSVLGLGMTAAVYAASTTADVFVHVFVVSGDVSIERTTVDANLYFAPQILANSSTTTAFAVSFRNAGDTNANWSIHAQSAFAGWTFLTDAPGTAIAAIDRCRLSAVFAANGAAPALANFTVDDVISGATIGCSATNYAITADAVGVKGYNVPPTVGASRYLFFRFDAPLAGSSNLNTDQVSNIQVTSASAI